MAGLFPFLGINFLFWTFVGLVRFSINRIRGRGFTEHLEDLYLSFRIDPSLKQFVSVLAGIITGIFGFSLLFFLTMSYVTNALFVLTVVLIWLFSGFLGGYVAGRIQKRFDKKALVVISFFYVVYFIFKFFQNTDYAEGVEAVDFIVFGILFLAAFLSITAGDYIGSFSKQIMFPFRTTKKNGSMPDYFILPHEVAAITPAHNEEVTVAKTISTIKQVLPAENIYVGSDASTDKTVEIARSLGVNVADIWPNKGKANVLMYLLEHYELLDKYKAVMIVDADSEIEPNYLEKALPMFDDSKVGAVAVHAMSKWEDHSFPEWSRFFAAYRVRFYRVLQAGMRYGQTWKYFNSSPIIPGFASIYRTSVLKEIEINAPNLVIEDFNMTFELHHKKLGTVGYNPQIHGISQDPVTLRDYYKQVKRWNLGFWQTVRRHGVWPSMFWLTLGLFLIEMIIYSVIFLILPLLFILLLINPSLVIMVPFYLTLETVQLTIIGAFVALFLLDYLMTVFVAVYEQKPILFIYGLGFFLLRYVDTFIFLYTLPLAFITKSDGKWKSPKRA